MVVIGSCNWKYAAKSPQSCPTLCNPIDGSPPGFPVPGIVQARTLKWVAISFSNAWKGKVKVKSLSRIQLYETPWSAAYQAPPSMGFSRQEYWSGVLLPSPIESIEVEISWSTVKSGTQTISWRVIFSICISFFYFPICSFYFQRGSSSDITAFSRFCDEFLFFLQI